MSTPPAPSTSVIIVNWNGGAHLATCLEALNAQTFRDFEVILVDNASTDGSVDAVERAYPHVRVLRQAENTGFAVGNNLGVAAARGAWIVLLNNDAFAAPTWLESLHEAARAHPEAAGFGSLQLQHHHPDRLDGAGDTYHASGLPWRAGYDQPAGPPWDASCEIFAPCAAAAMYRRDAFEEVAGFDPSFFCYLEDVDLAFRMRLRGHRFVYWPDAVVHHVGSASTGRVSDFARYHGHRNLVWCFVKNMPGALFWRHLPAHLAMTAVALTTFTLRGEGAPVWRAKWDALKGLPRVWAERRRIQAARTVAPAALESTMAHGWSALRQRSRAAR